MKSENIPLTLILMLLIPHITFAAWWNPFTWFDNSEVQPKIEVSVPEQDINTGQPESNIKAGSTENSNENINATDVVTVPIVNNTDQVEINALRKEIQTLKSGIQSVQTTNTNTVSATTEQNAKITEQLLNTITKLEQRISSLEDKIQNDDYKKLLARIEVLENKQHVQIEDQSTRIKTIIDRVNLLLHAGGEHINSTSSIAPIYCAISGTIGSEKGGEFNGMQVSSCENLYDDLKY